MFPQNNRTPGTVTNAPLPPASLGHELARLFDGLNELGEQISMLDTALMTVSHGASPETMGNEECISALPAAVDRVHSANQIVERYTRQLSDIRNRLAL